MITQIVLIRHGETDFNRQQLYLGHSDIPLNSTGISQINNIKHLIDTEKFNKIYSSDLLRCRQTTEILFGNDYIIDNNFRELNFGIFEGKNHNEINNQYPEEYQTWLQEPITHTIRNGESFQDFYQRVILVFKNILENNYGQKLAIITHGGCIRAILSHYLGRGMEDYWKFKIDLASINRLDFDNNFPYLTSLNEKNK